MSRRDDRVSLVDMLIYAKEAVALSSGTSLDEVVKNRVMQLALQKLVEIVGEAANRVSELDFIHLCSIANDIDKAL